MLVLSCCCCAIENQRDVNCGGQNDDDIVKFCGNAIAIELELKPAQVFVLIDNHSYSHYSVTAISYGWGCLSLPHNLFRDLQFCMRKKLFSLRMNYWDECWEFCSCSPLQCFGLQLSVMYLVGAHSREMKSCCSSHLNFDCTPLTSSKHKSNCLQI